MYAAAGDHHSIAITAAAACLGGNDPATSTSAVYSWGRNDSGQLGTGDRRHVKQPTCVCSLSGQEVVQADCSSAHSLFLTAQGRVLGCGHLDPVLMQGIATHHQDALDASDPGLNHRLQAKGRMADADNAYRLESYLHSLDCEDAVRSRGIDAFDQTCKAEAAQAPSFGRNKAQAQMPAAFPHRQARTDNKSMPHYLTPTLQPLPSVPSGQGSTTSGSAVHATSFMPVGTSGACPTSGTRNTEAPVRVTRVFAGGGKSGWLLGGSPPHAEEAQLAVSSLLKELQDLKVGCTACGPARC